MRTTIIAATIACTAASVGLIRFEAKAQSMMDQIVYNKCSSAMNADYQQAGKTAPAGLVDNMCKCVVKEISKLHSIEAAKSVCVAEFATKTK